MSLQDKISSAKPTTFLTDGLSEEEVKQAVDEGRKRSMSDTVKLIIEIPKEVKADIDNGVIRQNIDKIYLALAHGTPLDDVKAEIEKQIERDFAFAETETLKVPCHYGIANGLQNAIRFLDNIGKESEGAND